VSAKTIRRNTKVTESELTLNMGISIRTLSEKNCPDKPYVQKISADKLAEY